jgi:hypothetical protein
MATAAVLAGARSMTAIAEWAADAPQPVRAALGARRDAPNHWAVPAETTIRRTLARLDPQALAGAIGGWLADRDHPRRRRRALAVDGKTLRGARTPDGPPSPPARRDGPHHPHGAGPTPSRRRPRRGPRLPTPAERAGPGRGGRHRRRLQTHADAAEFLVTKQAHYLFVVKANQPTLLDRCAALAWHHVPVADRTRDRGHGRVEIRTLKAVSVHHFGFPHAAQVLQATRKVGDLATHKWHTVVVYAITSLSFQRARPARLADLIRGHWMIENGLHWVRDVTFAEDACKVRTGTAPQVMACLRNLAIGVLCRAGPVNLAAALRHHSRDPARPLATLGISLG